MAHRSLYRKYRPQSFEDVVGQSHVTRTLRNAVRDGAVAHAYLFAGPRGTGKTTTARILAKALLCESGPTPDPDNTCDQCVEVAEGRHPDVYELDAASRTGVENVREEIIGRVAFAPSRGRGKVYIIDEVHMLSVSAFNALLKTLEEPPSHVYFILCTTNPGKVLETIQSRCQRFDFHRIGIEDIVSRLEWIAEAEGISVAEGALTLVAKHASGGMRDAIGALEQLASFTGNAIAMADVEGLLGEVDSALLFEVVDLVAARDVGGAFRFSAALATTGVDIPEFARSLAGHFRDLFIMVSVGDAHGIVDRPEDDVARLSGQARDLGHDRLTRCLDILGELSAEMRWTSDPRLGLEVALARMCRPSGDLTLESLAERVAALEASAALSGAVSRAATTPLSATPETPALPATGRPEEDPATIADAEAAPELAEQDMRASTVGADEDQPSGSDERGPDSVGEAAVTEHGVSARAPGAALDRAAAKRAWPAVVQEMRKVRMSRAQLFTATEVDVDNDGATLVVEFGSDQGFALQRARDPESLMVLRNALASVLGTVPPVRYQLGRGPVRPAVEPVPVAHGARVDVPAATVPDETGGVPQAARADSEDRRSLEKQILEDLGAEVVVEHGHDEGGRKDDE